jgi:hypothetical protein
MGPPLGRARLPEGCLGNAEGLNLEPPGGDLSRIAQLDQRTALPDQCLHSAEADVRPPKEEVRV